VNGDDLVREEQANYPDEPFPGNPRAEHDALVRAPPERRIAALESALNKAADTFRDIGRTSRALLRPLVADACDIAENGCRAALSGATPNHDERSARRKMYGKLPECVCCTPDSDVACELCASAIRAGGERE
jgi:hypothetical protein